MKTLEKELNVQKLIRPNGVLSTEIDLMLEEIEKNHSKDILKRVGLDQLSYNLEKSEEFKQEMEALKNNGIYSLEQVKQVCFIYGLRFDHVSQYIGSLPEDFTKVLGNYLENNEVRTCSYSTLSGKWRKPAFYIMAPKENFKPIATRPLGNQEGRSCPGRR